MGRGHLVDQRLVLAPALEHHTPLGVLGETVVDVGPQGGRGHRVERWLGGVVGVGLLPGREALPPSANASNAFADSPFFFDR